MIADSETIRVLVQLRLVVGFLGEQQESRWWHSTFLGSDGAAFVSPVFARTGLLAQLRGVSEAAALVHDDRIGTGEVCHLFRLPESFEQRIQRAIVSSEDVQQQFARIDSFQTAAELLASLAKGEIVRKDGPIRIGNQEQLTDPHLWGLAAAHYAMAIRGSYQAFPFVSIKR